MRCPCFIGVDRRRSLKELADDWLIRGSTAGGWRIQIGPHVAHCLTVGVCEIEGVEVDVFCVLVTRGDQFKVFRCLEREGVLGPFDLSELPVELEALLIDRNSIKDKDGNVTTRGTVRSPYVLAGESGERVDDTRLVRGLDPDGALDRAVSSAAPPSPFGDWFEA